MPQTLSTRDGEAAAQSWRKNGGRPPSFPRPVRLLALLPPLVLALAVARWGVDLPFYDQWELVPRFLAWREGDFPWQQVWQRHNEHRLLLPELIMLALGRLSGWNILVELWVNLLLALGIFVLLASRLRGTLGGDRRLAFLLPIFSLLIFSPSQWGNWAWGWQIQIFLALLAVVAGIHLLAAERTPATLFGAILCAAAASFSFANGLLLFPLGLPLALAAKPRRAGYGAAWIAAALLVYLAYGAGGVGNRFHNDGDLLGLLWTLTRYILLYLSGPILSHELVVRFIAYSVVPLSFLLLAGLALRHGRELWRPLLPWATLCAFGLGSAAMTAYGRYSFGLGQALSTRYFTIANLYWLGLLGMVATVLRHRHPSPERLPRIYPGLAAAFAFCLLAGAAVGARDFAADSAERRQLRAALRGEIPAEGDLAQQVPFPDVEVVRQRIEMLRQLQLSLFRP